MGLFKSVVPFSEDDWNKPEFLKAYFESEGLSGKIENGHIIFNWE